MAARRAGAALLARCSSASSGRSSTSARGGRNRALLGIGVAALIASSLSLAMLGAGGAEDAAVRQQVEFQVVVNMPEGTTVERTAAVLVSWARTW